MTTIHYVIDTKTLNQTLTADDIETIELFREGEQVGSYRIKRMAARFMVDENKQPIPYKSALKIYGALTAEEYGEALQKFMEAMAETAIPKESANNSTSPLPASTQTSAPPDGPQP